MNKFLSLIFAPLFVLASQFPRMFHPVFSA